MKIKKRSIGLAILLSFVTLGFYAMYWFVQMTNESNQLAPKNRTASGGTALIFCILSFGIYNFYWTFKLGEKLDEAEGVVNGNRAALYLIFQVLGLGLVTTILAQSELNKYATH